MNKKIVSAITLSFLLAGILTLAFSIQLVRASGTIYIRADGSIDPPTASISTFDNITYTFTGDVNDSIVIERDSIVVDGAGYRVQGAGNGTGITLAGRTNITIQNTVTEAFEYGIYLGSSSGNSITRNNITNNGNAIVLYSSLNNSITENNITANNNHGIVLHYSSNNSIAENNVAANNHHGIYLFNSSGNSMTGNSITDSLTGIYLYNSSNNIIYHDKFINNTAQVQSVISINVWDDGYPSGGNYWSDYASKYPNATEIDSSGIWNTPYVIDTNNIDHYPVVPEFPSLFIIPMCILTSLAAIIASRKKRLKAAGR